MFAFLMNLVVSFVVRQFLTFTGNINWATVKSDWAVRIAALIPGTFLDAAAIEICNGAIDCLALALNDQTGLQAIGEAVAAGDWAKVLSTLVGLIQRVEHPSKNALIAALS